MPATTSAGALTITRIFNARRERVFSAWTTAEALKQWHSPDPMRVREATVDLRVGGRYRIVMAGPDGTERIVGGTYREIDSPQRLVYTWQWETTPGFPETDVIVEFTAQGNATEVRVTHTGIPDENSRSQHERGWMGCTARLETFFTTAG
ncbi:MAG TPA: SRPBCC domain-containing protein [Gemmatimonadales bacterium]|jgi:glutathione S-transferase